MGNLRRTINVAIPLGVTILSIELKVIQSNIILLENQYFAFPVVISETNIGNNINNFIVSLKIIYQLNDKLCSTIVSFDSCPTLNPPCSFPYVFNSETDQCECEIPFPTTLPTTSSTTTTTTTTTSTTSTTSTTTTLATTTTTTTLATTLPPVTNSFCSTYFRLPLIGQEVSSLNPSTPLSLFGSGTGSVTNFPNNNNFVKGCGVDRLMTPSGNHLGLSTNNSDTPSSFSYTGTFSRKVNNFKLFLYGLDATPNLESFTITTSSGVPTITSSYSCFSQIVGNVITSTYNDVIGNSPVIIFTITTLASYNSFTIAGPGGSFGSAMFGCLESLFIEPPLTNCASPVNLPLPGYSILLNGGQPNEVIVTGRTLGWNLGTLNTFFNRRPACSGDVINFPIGATLVLGRIDYPLTNIVNYEIIFSKKVNNIKLVFIDHNFANGVQEAFTITTDSGVPTLVANYLCKSTINGNILEGQLFEFDQYPTAVLLVQSLSSYNRIVINGEAGANGTMLYLCNDSMEVDLGLDRCRITGILPLPGTSITVPGYGVPLPSNPITIQASSSNSGFTLDTISGALRCGDIRTPPQPTLNIDASLIPGVIDYTLTFSQPVNNFRLGIADGDPLINTPNIVITTSNGVPTLLSETLCRGTILGNQVSESATIDGTFVAITTIIRPLPYTSITLTITGASNNLSLFNCLTQLIPFI